MIQIACHLLKICLFLGYCCGCSTGGPRKMSDSESMSCKLIPNVCLGNCRPRNTSQLTVIPKDIPDKIAELEIVGSNIDTIKEADLQHLTCLKKLDLSDNKLPQWTPIPSSIYKN